MSMLIYLGTVGIGIVAQHVSREVDKLVGVEAPTVCIEVITDLFGSDVSVDELGMAEVPVSQIVDCIADELGGGTFDGFVGGKRAGEDDVLGFLASMDNSEA